MKAFLERHRFQIINLSLFFFLAPYVAKETFKAWDNWERLGAIDWVDLTFFVHNSILMTLILIRKDHAAVSESRLDHCIAVFAFFSGLLFLERVTADQRLLSISKGVILTALVAGTASLLNLGRSFGILVAMREIRTTGLYSIVRHPMYFTDILWKVGMVLKKPCPFNFALFVLTVACYAWRAAREERFLSNWQEYRVYMERVRYRFVPFLY